MIFDTHCHEFSEVVCGKNNIAYDLPFCVPEIYNKGTLPSPDEPINITVVVNLVDIINVDDNDYTITFTAEISITWLESRLKLNLNSSKWLKDRDGVKWTDVDLKYLDVFWMPSLDILNVKKFEIHSILETQGFVELYEDKRLWYEIPVDITLHCPLFDFQRYPFDTQACEFYIGSYIYESDTVMFSGKVFYNLANQRKLQYQVKEITALSFEEGLINYTSYYNSLSGKQSNEILTYSHFGVKMAFERKLQQHILCTYLPSFLLVLCSWIGFLINPDKVPGRIALSVTLLLVLINMR